MSFLTGTDNAALRPDDHGAAFYQGLQRFSVALQASTTIYTGSTRYRLPIITGKPSADWTAEGAEIAVSDPTTTEIIVTPKKLAALTYVSQEMVEDSENQAVLVVTQGMTGDLANKLDEAAFGNPASVEAPIGLADIAGVSTVTVSGGALVNLDWANEAKVNAEEVYRKVDVFVTSPATALELANLKESTGSNRSLLTPDATVSGRNLVAGVPLLISPHVAADTIWAIPRDCFVTVLRTPATLDFSQAVAFSSHRIAIRGVQRAAFAVPHAAAVTKVTVVA